MQRCAFLTLSDPAGYVMDDDWAVDAFAAHGWAVSLVPWDRPREPWSSFEAVLVRSTWDYYHHLEKFLDLLGEIAGQRIPLFNPIDLLQWNASKDYLGDLARRGVPIVPTVFLDRIRPGDCADLFARLGSREIVVKPLVSANAEGAFRLRSDDPPDRVSLVQEHYAERPLLAQPFARAVREEGEFSLIYFDGAFSHGILKTPTQQDFRVQEEHGGTITSIQPSAGLFNAGASAMAALTAAPLYARVDLVRANEGEGFWLMEMELIEPSLYLRKDEEAPRRFAAAFARRMGALL